MAHQTMYALNKLNDFQVYLILLISEIDFKKTR